VVAASLSALCGGLWLAELESRPACPPGYVRLIDLDPVALFFSVAMFVFSLLLVVLASRRRESRRRARWMVAAGVAVTLLALAGSLSAAEMIHVNTDGSPGSCWTF
jgi:heme A synthase